MPPLDVNRRVPVWIALSDLYLDTEMQAFTHWHIARTIEAVGYTLEEARLIDRYEVFPVLYPNMLSVAGVWDGFDGHWLAEKIQREIVGSNRYQRIKSKIAYFLLADMFDRDHRAIERAYRMLRAGE